MADQPRHTAAWIRLLTGTALTVSFAVAVVWGARAYGRSIVFAFGVNWVLMVWAIMLPRTSFRSDCRRNLRHTSV